MATSLTALAATLAGSVVGGTAGASAALNETANNYLRHVEALRLAELENRKAAGKCDANCDRDIDDLKALDAARNQELANCVGINSSDCDRTRKQVRTAAAEYIRNAETLNSRGAIYAGQYIATTELAYATINGKSTGVWLAIKDMVSQAIDGIGTLYKAKDGDSQSIAQVIAGTKALKEFLGDSSNLPYLVGFMTPSQRQVFATAVESGNGAIVGKNAHRPDVGIGEYAFACGRCR